MFNEATEAAQVVDQIGGAPGTDVKHESADKHVSGEAIYVDDMLEPRGLLHAYVGFSANARALIQRLDLDQVIAAEGVVAVLSLQDVPGITDIGCVFPGDPILVNEGDEIEFYGQALFAVAATTYTQARRAVLQAQIEYQVLTPVRTIQEGIDQNSIIAPPHTHLRGDPDQAVIEAPLQLQGQLEIGGQEHMYLEGHISLATPTEEGGMVIYSSNQYPSETQKLVAGVLDIPMNKVIVDVRRMGGGFGGKESNANQWACIAALLAQKTGRPIKLRLARTDDIQSTGKRHPFLCRYQVGFDRSGVIRGLNMDLYGGCGISPDLSNAIVDRAMFHSDNAYFLPEVRITGHRIKTHWVSNTAFRGFGAPQGMLSIEHLIDRIARSVNKDPLDVRYANLYNVKDSHDTTHYGQKIEQHILPSLMLRLEKKSQYRQRRIAIEAFNQKSKYQKRGLALTPVKFGVSFTVQHLNQAGAIINIFTDGSIQLNHGGTEMGQGLLTKVAQIVAHEFQVDISTIQCMATRTDKVPNASPTAASSGSDLNGMAAKNAAEKLKRRLIEFSARHFNISAETVSFSRQGVLVGSEVITFAELVQLAYFNRVSLSATGYYKTPKIWYNRKLGQGRPFYYYANGAAVSEVLVDTLTGEYKVTQVDICHDVGQSINPGLDIGQIEGGFVQGMGWLTTEELVWNSYGKLLSNSPANYKIPTVDDIPESFTVELYPDSPNIEATIFHSKAVGEPPLMLAISVWCAIRDAVSAISDYRYSPELDAPATPERVLLACLQMRKQIETKEQA